MNLIYKRNKNRIIAFSDSCVPTYVSQPPKQTLSITHCIFDCCSYTSHMLFKGSPMMYLST